MKGTWILIQVPFYQLAPVRTHCKFTYALLAQTHLLNGNFKETQDIISRIEKHINLFPVTNFDLGNLYMGLGQFEKSRDFFQKAFETNEGRMLSDPILPKDTFHQEASLL